MINIFKLYEITVSYEIEDENRNVSSFTYMDILNNEDVLDDYLLDKHSSEYIVTDIDCKEIIFEGYQIRIVKNN